jgi:tRNA(Ile)-lysidine synthetase-like protein
MIIRKGIGSLRPGLRDIGFEAVERMVQFLSHPVTSGQIDIGSGLMMSIESELSWIYDQNYRLPLDRWPQIQTGDEVKLSIPGSVTLTNNWMVEIESVELTEEIFQTALENEDPFQAWISLDDVEGPLIIKSRSPGDRIRPIGMQTGTIKLSDLMINEKIPARARSQWPVVYTGRKAVWVPGMRLSQAYQIGKDTQRVAHIRMWQKQ